MAQILQPQRRKDALESLAQALGIAQSVYGIRASSAALDRARGQIEQQEQLAPIQKETAQVQLEQLKQRPQIQEQQRQRQITEKSFESIDKIRKERNASDITKATGKVVSSLSRIQSTPQSPAGDLALIFNYMKILDPGSVVRESEFANAERAGSFAQRVHGIALKFTGEGRLDPVQRKDFMDQARNLTQAQIDVQNDFDRQLKDTASARGLKPKSGELFQEFSVSKLRKAKERKPDPQKGKAAKAIAKTTERRVTSLIEAVDSMFEGLAKPDPKKIGGLGRLAEQAEKASKVKKGDTAAEKKKKKELDSKLKLLMRNIKFR